MTKESTYTYACVVVREDTVITFEKGKLYKMDMEDKERVLIKDFENKGVVGKAKTIGDCVFLFCEYYDYYAQHTGTEEVYMIDKDWAVTQLF